MKISVKSLRTKPQVSITVAVGALELKADSLADSCILTALSRVFSGMFENDPAIEKIGDAILAAAHEADDRMKERKPPFTMIQRKPRAK